MSGSRDAGEGNSTIEVLVNVNKRKRTQTNVSETARILLIYNELKKHWAFPTTPAVIGKSLTVSKRKRKKSLV